MFYFSEIPSSQNVAIAMKTKKGKFVRKPKILPIEMSMDKAGRAFRGPNMSKKNRGTKLYPFPSFDKCDSLLFFPCTYSSCLNSGDLIGLERLFKHRSDKLCDFTLGGRTMDVDTCLAAFKVTSERHPDSVLCVYQTKVIGNEIRAFLYFKYTENKIIRKGLETTVSDRSLLEMCPTPGANTSLLESHLSSKSEEEQRQVQALVCVAEDVVVYGTSTLTLTFDDATKKITHFRADCQYTSFQTAQAHS